MNMLKPDRIVTTTCPHCDVGCNLELHIKDDYIYSDKRVTPSLIRQTPQIAGCCA